MTNNAERENPRVQSIIERAENHYKLGERNLKDGKRAAARRAFDLSIDSVLEFGVDVRSNPRLQRYYLELVERIYQAEGSQGVPAPLHRSLSTAVPQTGTPAPPQIGFVEQKFEPSPLDELSKLVLTNEQEPSTLQTGDQSSTIRIHLVGGGRLDVDEATETADGIWYRRGQVTVFLDRARVARVERTQSINPLPKAPPISITSFPVNYGGVNAATVYSAVSKHKRALKKSQFETTPEYQARIKKVLKSISISPGVTAGDELTFVVTNPDESYDADSRTYKVSVDDDLGSLSDEGGLASTITLGYSGKTLGSAVGQNAFGVKRRFKIRSYTYVKLALPYESGASWTKNLIITDVPVTEARQMMGHVRVALIGKLRAPFVAEDTSYDNATISEPEESHFFNFFVAFEPHALVLFNRRTGEVLATLDKNGSGEIKYPRKRDRRAQPSQLQELEATVQPQANPPSASPPPPDAEPVLLSRPQPIFPEQAREKLATGTVKLNVQLGADGTVTNVKVIEGLPHGLTESAIEAARRIKFIPARRNGNNISVWLYVDYEFNLL